jgi:hypothetical protein
MRRVFDAKLITEVILRNWYKIVECDISLFFGVWQVKSPSQCLFDH